MRRLEVDTVNLSARTPDGSEITLEQKALDDLKSRIRGELLHADMAGYADVRTVWNAMIDRRPALIVRCLGVADVVAGVKFAREHGVSLSIKGGGHNIAGLAVSDGGLMLDMSLARGVWVDPVGRVARAQAGCLLGDVDRETQLHGLAANLGFVSNTGAAGLTVGGGFGYLTRRFGWTCDSVQAMEVVTAEGRVVKASETENADLLWGLRGGGGNFGVVTGFDYRLNAVGPEIVGGAIAWPAEEAPRVLELFRTTMAQAPPELTCVAALRKAPPAPWLNPAIHGRNVVAIFICCSGSPEEGERLVAPIKQFGKPVGDIVQRRTYVSQQSLLDATQPKGRRYYWKSEYLPGHAPEFLAAAIEHASRVPSPHSAILIFPLDGALNRLPADHSAAGNRDAVSVVNIASSWDKPEDDSVNIEWARQTWRDLRRFSTGGTYVNFLTEEEGVDRIRAAYGALYDRLAAVKARWDPTNMFRANKNVPPKER
jgi:FAD/FMN-containing dehydrogenase